jgi:hypothetical protein
MTKNKEQETRDKKQNVRRQQAANINSQKKNKYATYCHARLWIHWTILC